MATLRGTATNLPDWSERLRKYLPARVGMRERDAGVFVRAQRQLLRARPVADGEFALRAFAPALFGRCVGVLPDSHGSFLMEAPARGRRLDRSRGEARYLQLALLVWGLHCAGRTPEDVALQRILATDSGLKLLTPPEPGDEARAATALAWARAFVTGRKATAGLRADRLAPLVLRVLGGEGAAPSMLRMRMGALPDVESWRSAMNAALTRAMTAEIPVIVVAGDAEQAAAIHALICEAAVGAGVSAGDGALFSRADQMLRLIGPLSIAECERRLGRLSPGPTLAIVVGAPLDAKRELEHVGEVAAPVRTDGRGLFDWLRPLGVEPSLAVEELTPVLERDPAGARQLVAALIERAGAVMTDDGPVIAPDWVEHWQAIRGRRNALSVLQPDAARVAHLLALSPGGLCFEAVDDSRDLKRGAAMLQDIGIAIRDRGVIRAADGARMTPADTATRRALLQWLAERDHFAPDQQADVREAWRIGLRLRGGDLACWYDDHAEKLLHRLVERHAYDEALQLIEAHAAGSVRSPAGPPSIDVLYTARDLGLSHWKPRRLRRALRMWLRSYEGEWRAVTLAVLSHVERLLGGIESYTGLIDELEHRCEDLPRFAREQALIEAAHCCCLDDPARALRLLEGVAARPARAATYLCESRMLALRAECEFVAIRIEESFALVQQAREKLSRNANRLMRARLEAEIEVRHMVCHSMLSFYKTDAEVLLQPVRAIEAEHNCVGDILRGAIVNDYLMRMRTWEVGLMTPEQMNFVLAEARPDNLRGYLIALYQLEENAIHRGEFGVARKLSARIAALNRTGDHNQIVYSAWRRHDAVTHALGGDVRAALQSWTLGRSWHITEPWRTRTRILRRGEWGFLLMTGGKWDKAGRAFQAAFDGLAAMSARGRGSVYLMCRLICDLLAGRDPGQELRDYLTAFAERGYILARLVQLILNACDAPAQWSVLAERVEESPAPEFWKTLALSFGAVLARRAHTPVAEQLAYAARGKLRRDWSVLTRWLDREFPAQQPVGSELSATALRAVMEMQQPAQSGQRAFAELADAALRKACGGSAGVQIGLDTTVFTNARADAELAGALERALLGETVDEPGLCALSLRTPFGAIACKGGSCSLPVLKAVSRRLAELHELADARQVRNSRRVHARDAVRAAWALASGDPSPAARLAALRTLVMAETGASDCELTVLRGAAGLLSSGTVAAWSGEASAAIDTSLRLRTRIAGGDPLELDESTQRAARTFAAILEQAPERLRMELGRPGDGEELVVAGEKLGLSPASRRLYDDMRRFADLDLSVVVIGEAGSGKDLAVRGMQAMSTRSAQPLVVIDCPTLRRETAASELFGHVRGAFTGATQDHVGLLERAAEGVLQVDGLGNLDTAIQAMLLRAFQVRSFLPVGATGERQFRARIVVTSDRPLGRLVDEGQLREDLAQRLQGVSLNIPPLRERGDDALLFAREVLETQGRQLNRRLRLSRSAERFIRDHDWPGNVRELKSAVTRACVMANGDEIGVDDLYAPDVGTAPTGLVMPQDAPGLNTSSRLILALLRQLGQAQPSMLVRRLGISRTTVSTTLSELARLGFCERYGAGRATAYRAT
ncbi:MAG: sigma-54-dependent Fis family transcriptional regulator [Planctomycetes bacterium]|nr:sigma-54-dependent Fis family transcriptional regulator [Planctomycetota bacterium]